MLTNNTIHHDIQCASSAAGCMIVCLCVSVVCACSRGHRPIDCSLTRLPVLFCSPHTDPAVRDPTRIVVSNPTSKAKNRYRFAVIKTPHRRPGGCVWLVPTCLTDDPSVTNAMLPSFGPLTCREKCTNAMELLCSMGLCQDVLPVSSPSSCPLGKCPTAPSVGNHAISTLIQNSLCSVPRPS